jgi:hypothetical protein
MTVLNKPLCLKALDMLALALTTHNHTWTDEERRLYEEAVKELKRGEPQRPIPDPLDYT